MANNIRLYAVPNHVLFCALQYRNNKETWLRRKKLQSITMIAL